MTALLIALPSASFARLEAKPERIKSASKQVLKKNVTRPDGFHAVQGKELVIHTSLSNMMSLPSVCLLVAVFLGETPKTLPKDN